MKILIVTQSVNEASRGARVIKTSCGLDSHSRKLNLKYLQFSFLRSGVKPNRCVGFRHITRNASRIKKIGNGVSWH